MLPVLDLFKSYQIQGEETVGNGHPLPAARSARAAAWRCKPYQSLQFVSSWACYTKPASLVVLTSLERSLRRRRRWAISYRRWGLAK